MARLVGVGVGGVVVVCCACGSCCYLCSLLAVAMASHASWSRRNVNISAGSSWRRVSDGVYIHLQGCLHLAPRHRVGRRSCLLRDARGEGCLLLAVHVQWFRLALLAFSRWLFDQFEGRPSHPTSERPHRSSNSLQQRRQSETRSNKDCLARTETETHRSWRGARQISTVESCPIAPQVVVRNGSS
jgi:hypothetical protein